VTDLLFYEISNALRYNPHFTESDVKDALQSIYDMELNIIRADKDLLCKAIEIAFSFKVSVYDAVFIATAKRLNNAFLTADYKFYDRIKDLQNVMRLSGLNFNANNFI